jgi:hypothetical protein
MEDGEKQEMWMQVDCSFERGLNGYGVWMRVSMATLNRIPVNSPPPKNGFGVDLRRWMQSE